MMSSTSPNLNSIYGFDDLLEVEELTGVKYELLDGRLFAMTGGTKAHNLIALGLFTEIDLQKNEQCRLYVADVKLRIESATNENEKDSSTYPDVMLACDEENSDIYETNPILIAEILSDTTARKDKVTKKEKYLDLPSLHAYIILSQTEIMMTLYQRKNNEWLSNIFLGKDTDIEIDLGSDHKPVKLNLGKVYKYLENRI